MLFRVAGSVRAFESDGFFFSKVFIGRFCCYYFLLCDEITEEVVLGKNLENRFLDKGWV